MSTELYDLSVTEESFRSRRQERISEYGEPNTLAGFRRLRQLLVEEIQHMPDTSAFEVILDVNRSDLLYVERRIRELEAEQNVNGFSSHSVIHPQTGRRIMIGNLITPLNQELADVLRQINTSPQSIELTRLIIRFLRLYREAQSLGSTDYSENAQMMRVVLNERLEQLQDRVRELSRILEQAPSQNSVINTIRYLEDTNQEIREIQQGYESNGPRFDSEGRLVERTSNFQVENTQQTIMPPTESNQEKELQKQSYETLLKQLYNLQDADALPEFLIINGLRVSFISFEEITQMLNQNQIERYIIEPLFQPWAGKPGNRILTMYAKNGVTYLIKVRFDRVNNSINQPV
jgi:hypothetical protein